MLIKIQNLNNIALVWKQMAHTQDYKRAFNKRTSHGVRAGLTGQLREMGTWGPGD